jgi:hypothetical protein
MSKGSLFFTHEAHQTEISQLFFNEDWWGTHQQSQAPGLIGAGSGLGLTLLPSGFMGSCLAFTIKEPTLTKEINQIGVDR